ncbi:hypothetical protein FDB55_09755 [Clostridium botulinum]|uniref:Uncharacterized protein n=1 Tax=Clostridium botulinum TaxID=1491 RepID=A0A0L9YBY7_CLOBO|nr:MULTISPECIES: hypothetical protein [Clostridium]KAI3349634.1 hypothetical protein CIT18_07560 [Clostridium botulinum]KOM89291.1 hypothetical protein ACP51_02570 [Clostridium botulinum]KOR58215.1 hypothetical protein ADT22_10585 [Clostridium botulinum]MBN1040595.1 hypothetical protein [Clostridium botulinum]MBN1047247.1 hypothetical protein [Clostridium botulinum]
MKKRIAILLITLVAFSLAGCNSKPPEEKIKSALDDGTITFADAKTKGWIDDEWIEKNYKPIEGSTKIYLFEPFDTTYLDGSPASSKLIEGKMCLVFFNTQKIETMNKLEVFNKAYEDMQAMGIPILGIITDKDLEGAKEKLTNIKFPMIVYNQEMQKSLKQYTDIDESDVISIFTKEGGFYSAWNNSVTLDELLTFAKKVVDDD